MLDGEMVDEALRKRRWGSWRVLARRSCAARQRRWRALTHGRIGAAGAGGWAVVRGLRGRAGLRRRSRADAQVRPCGALHQAIARRPAAAGAGRPLCRRRDRSRPAAGPPDLVCDVAIGQSTLTDAARDRQPLLPRAGAPAPGALGGHAAHAHRGRGAASRIGLKPRARRPPGSWCCGSARWIRRIGRCWTSGAARCCRCATRTTRTGHADELDAIPADARSRRGARGGAGGLAPRGAAGAAAGPAAADPAPGAVCDFEGGETRDRSPELARLTLNVATAHTRCRGQRPAGGSSTAGTRSGSRPRT